MSGDLTYDVRVWKTEIYRGAKVTTYTVRWKAGANDLVHDRARGA